MLPEGVPAERPKAKIIVKIYRAEGLPKSKDLEFFVYVLGCIPFDQSESGFFNRKLDQIADPLEHKIQKWICFTRMSLG